MNLYKQVSSIRPAGSFEIMDTGNGPFIHPLTLDFVQPTAAELEAAVMLYLRSVSAIECRRRVCTIASPFDGQPLSSRTDPDQMLSDALAVWANATDYAKQTTADPSVVSAINAAITERFRLLACNSANKLAINAGRITAEAQVLDPARW